MLKTTRDMIMPTAITGSYPRPLWFDRSLDGRSFKAALGDSLFREQYLDAVAAIINAQEAAGLDIVTDGDSRFDLAVGGKSWFFYPIERLGGVTGHREFNPGWHTALDLKNLLTVSEAIARAALERKESRGAQFREDYPNKDDRFSKVNTMVSKAPDGSMQIRLEPLPEMPEYLKQVVEEPFETRSGRRMAGYPRCLPHRYSLHRASGQ